MQESILSCVKPNGEQAARKGDREVDRPSFQRALPCLNPAFADFAPGSGRGSAPGPCGASTQIFVFRLPGEGGCSEIDNREKYTEPGEAAPFADGEGACQGVLEERGA